MQYAIIDIETTGGSPKNEKITEIAIFIHDGQKVIDEFVTLINPERKIPYYITQLTGIDNEMVSRAPKFYEVAKRIVELTQDKIFVAHNVSFDYNFVKSEYKQLGYNYNRDKLCTVQLSRKLIPGHRSYSLGNLCNEIGIEINGRHRAAGDALATVKLFEILLDVNEDEIISNPKLSGNYLAEIHPNLDPQKVKDLPELAGVYYFYNDKNELIYIGKSINIHSRIIQHFSNNKSKKAMEMKLQIADISYELTGSELIAMLLESDEIKKNKPVFNRAQRRSVFTYGLYHRIDENGYIIFSIEKNNKNSLPLTTFSSQAEGKRRLYQFIEEYLLCQKLCGLYKSNGSCFHYEIMECNGACIGEEEIDHYNERALKLIDKYTFENSNFLVIGEGRNIDEKSIVHVQNGKYMGFGYIDDSLDNNNLEIILDCVKSYPDNREVQQIIRSFIRKHNTKIIQL